MSRPRSPKTLIGAGLGLLLLAGLLVLLHEDEARPLGALDDVIAFRDRDDFNVLFILVDTLRADHLSAYGYARPTSPNIASLAESGIRFAHHVSQSSWTKCSMASLWTGLYPARTRVLRTPHAIAEASRMPAEILREAGFRTAGIWRNAWVGPKFGFAQGFQTYTQPKPTRRDRSIPREHPNLALIGSDADVLVSARSFLRSYGHQRWFLYLHMMDVHQYVYTPEQAVFGTSYRDIYDNSILWVDKLIGHLLEELDRRELRDRTLIVFAADHGEAFGEHGNEGHARDVYGEVTETPLILSFPFRLEPGLVVAARTANVDLWPTVLELTGLPPLPDPDGRSRLPEIVAAARDTSAPEQGTVFAQLDQTWGRDGIEPQPLVAVSRGPWRLFYPAARPEQLELYDKTRDPREQTNVSGDHPDVTEALARIARDHLESPPPPWGEEAPAVELDDMDVELLRALGYGVQ